MILEKNIYHQTNKLSLFEKKRIVNFLYEHLNEYRDSIEAIEEAIQYALKEIPSFGGVIITGSLNDELVSVVVVNKTGMRSYIPENILVYVATDVKMRGKGIASELIRYTQQHVKGDIALHVEAENPARFLYEKLGFENKYLEMRYIKKE